MERLLSTIEVNKANGPDAISLRILKECPAELAPSITQLFNFSLDHGKLLSVWKSANVVPIHKSGERTLAENYRPVSLKSILVKSSERIIHKHIMKFLTHHSLRVRASMVLKKLVHVALNFFSCYTHGSVLSRKVIQSMWSSWILQKPSTGSLIITCFISCSVIAFLVGCFPGFMTICQTVHKESLLEVIHQIGWGCPKVFLKGV